MRMPDDCAGVKGLHCRKNVLVTKTRASGGWRCNGPVVISQSMANHSRERRAYLSSWFCPIRDN